MHVWNVLHAAGWKYVVYRTQKLCKKITLCAPSHNFVELYFRNLGIYRRSEKLVKQQYILQVSPQCGELRLTNGWDRLASLWHPSKFQRVSLLRFVTASTSLTGGQPNLVLCLAVSWLLHLYKFIIFGGSATWRNFARCKVHFASRSCAFCYIGSVTVRHWSSGRQPKFAVCYGITELSQRAPHPHYSTARPSRWSMARVLVCYSFQRANDLRF